VQTPVKSVALNALFLAPGESGGPETYLRQLVPALADEYPGVRLVVFTTGQGRRALAGDGWHDFADVRSLPTEEYRRMRRQLCEQLALPVAARWAGVELLHSLANTGPLRGPGLAMVLTLHDVIFMQHATFGRATSWGLNRVVPGAARRADSLIVASASARDEICSILGLDPGRFTVVPHGVGPVPRVNPADEVVVRAKLGLERRRVVLCLAALRPHKNQELLVRAAGSLPDDVAIVLAGPQERYVERVKELASELAVTDRVRLAGYMADPEVESLWSMADCGAFPTLAEGFGLPILEGMARGVPIACSDIPVLREVGGDVPCYFEPHDPAAAAAAITNSLGDRERGRLGVERASRFSWSDAARGTMEAYERASIASR
jgi:glycosyltransferase involved in cell wall biosynthesis